MSKQAVVGHPQMYSLQHMEDKLEDGLDGGPIHEKVHQILSNF